MKNKLLLLLLCSSVVCPSTATVQCGPTESKEPNPKQNMHKRINEILSSIQSADPDFHKTLPAFNPTGSEHEEEKYVNDLIQRCITFLNSIQNTSAIKKEIAEDVWNNKGLAPIGLEIITRKTRTLLLEHGEKLLRLAYLKKIQELNDFLLLITKDSGFLSPCIWTAITNIVYASLCAVEGKLMQVRPNFISENFAEQQIKDFCFFVFKDNWITRSDAEKLTCAHMIMKKMFQGEGSRDNERAYRLTHEIVVSVIQEYPNAPKEITETIKWFSSSFSIQ
ncbi:hypothetical protein HOD08_04775 [bacterium]|nr:hypothetical protein [bacterium]